MNLKNVHYVSSQIFHEIQNQTHSQEAIGATTVYVDYVQVVQPTACHLHSLSFPFQTSELVLSPAKSEVNGFHGALRAPYQQSGSIAGRRRRRLDHQRGYDLLAFRIEMSYDDAVVVDAVALVLEWEVYCNIFLLGEALLADTTYVFVLALVASMTHIRPLPMALLLFAVMTFSYALNSIAR